MFIVKLWTGFVGLPRWAKWAIAAGIAFMIWLQFHDRKIIREHDAGIEAKVQATASAAASDAHEAVKTAKTEVEQTNDQARQDAAVSEDPLRAGFDRLRRDNPRSQPPR